MYHVDVRTCGLAACLLAYLAALAPAWAGIEDWQLNEVVTTAAGDTDVRYIELYNEVGGCFFGTSRIVVYDAAGTAMGSTQLVQTTTCYDPGSYFLLATPQADAALGMTADHLGAPALPTDAGQVCFSSTSTRYDCVRWGTIDTAVTDLLGNTDATSATPPPDSQSLARVLTTHIVSDDWQVLPPTPGDANDGVIWTPPDAGPTPDAGVALPDAGVAAPDAAPMPTVDASPVAVDAAIDVDAPNLRYLDLAPAGGACGCRADAPASGDLGALLLVLALLYWRRKDQPAPTAL